MLRSRRWCWFTVGVALVASLVGCGLSAEPGAPPPTSVTTPSASPSLSRSASASAKPGLLVGNATVLDDGDGPELCLGGVLTSLPPQCGGPKIDGWVWPKEGTERVNRVVWGSFMVVGTLDGKRFDFDRVVTEEQAKSSLPAEEELDFKAHAPSRPAAGRRRTRPGPPRTTRPRYFPSPSGCRDTAAPGLTTGETPPRTC